MSTDTPTAQPERTRRSQFSTDEETFDHDTKWGALDAMYEDDRLHLGAEYYEAEFEQADPCSAIGTSMILDLADEWLRDNECLAEDDDYFIHFTADARAELDQLLRAWHDKHKPNVTLWWPVGKTITHTVTAEDLAEFHAGNPGEGQ